MKIRFPNAPAECRKVLFDTYGDLMDKKITAADWEIFSGAYNRHIHLKIKICGGKKQKTFRYLYMCWQSLNRLRHYKGKLLMIAKAVKERAHLVQLKDALQEALDA